MLILIQRKVEIDAFNNVKCMQHANLYILNIKVLFSTLYCIGFMITSLYELHL